jgi:hypothetical protein
LPTSKNLARKARVDPGNRAGDTSRVKSLIPALKLAAYYLLVALLTAGAVLAMPQLREFLPFGGTGQLASGVEELVSGRANRISWEPVAQAINLALALTAVIVVMGPVTWVYMGVRRKRGKEQSFLLSILLLPQAVAAIVLIVQNSLALAFSLAGIVAGVRFRLTLDDTIDAIYIFVAIGAGLAAGIEAIEIALVLTMFFNFAVLVLWQMDFAEDVAGNRWFTRTWMNRAGDDDA